MRQAAAAFAEAGCAGSARVSQAPEGLKSGGALDGLRTDKRKTAARKAAGVPPAASAGKNCEAALRSLGYRVAHEIPGRLRLRRRGRTSFAPPGTARAVPLDAGIEAARLLLLAVPQLGTEAVRISPVTGSILVEYAGPALRRALLNVLLPPAATSAPFGRARSLPKGAGAKTGAPPAERVVRNPIPGKAYSYFYPRVLTRGLALLRALPYIWTGIKALFRGRLNLDALDGAALTVCLLRRDFKSLSSIVFFFALGEYLADWTRKKSRASLAESLALNIDHVWIKEGELERRVPVAETRPGDLVVVRAGSVLPVDGTVAEGDGMVNQASMTGESMPVRRTVGSTVYAGTVLEEGEMIVAASRVGGDTRINAILRSIEESESVKASIQGRYERVADSIVPYNFLLSGAVYAATRDPLRAGSVLLVDYSCAIRLATPLTIFTGMREAAERGVLIKGGKFMEAVAEADVVIFDKTGTLTEARPTVAEVIPFGGRTRDTVLRLAACLEEHFVHPVGQAVVRAAEAEGLKHREEHAKVEFVVAHGIASRWRGQRVLIGSGHFVLEDEGISATSEQRSIIDSQAAMGRSVLYLAVGGELAGIILIEDNMRKDAPAMVEALREDGIRRVIMLTGDGELTARGIAERAGIAEYRSRLLPEDKAAFVASLKNEGHKVIMVGDGINDSPALSAADVGVAMAEGADMAREVADIVLVNGELSGILLARKVARIALARVRSNFRASLLWNSLFLLGGLTGLLRPGLSALLHNATTAAIAVSSVRPMLSPFERRCVLESRPAPRTGSRPEARLESRNDASPGPRRETPAKAWPY